MALPSWPDTPHEWLTPWVVWRFDGKPDPKPNIPEDMGAYPYAQEVLAWVAWQRKGRPDPRPDVTKIIPAWAQDVLKAVNQAVPIAIPGGPPPSWVTPWAIWRFQGADPALRPPNLPAEYSVRYPWVWSFLRWVGWRRKGAPLPRPTDIPDSIPKWCWDALRTINIAVPTGPPKPPPPPPPPPVPPSSWTLPNPLMYTTWGWLTDADFRNVDVIAQRMKLAGVKTVGLQIGQYPPEIIPRLRAYGFYIFLWGSPDASDNLVIERDRPDGYMPQIEGPYEAQRAIANIEAGYGQGISLAIVTTLSGLDNFIQLPDGSMSTVEAEKLKAAGCTHGWVECYKQGGPSHFPISKMEWGLKQRGIPHFSPLIGLYWDVPVSDYMPDLAPFGKQMGAYTAETMRPEDWIAFAQLGT